MTGEPKEFLEKLQAPRVNVSEEPLFVEDDNFSDDDVLELVDCSSEKINPIESQPTDEDQQKSIRADSIVKPLRFKTDTS